MSVYPTQSGWGVDWRDHEGRRHRKFVGTEAAARQLDAHLRASAAEARQVKLLDLPPLKLTDAAEAYQRWTHTAPTTQEHTRKSLRYCLQLLPTTDANQVTEQTMQDLAHQLRNKHAWSTAASYLNELRRLLAWLAHRHLIHRDPGANVSIKATAPEPRHVLTHAEELALQPFLTPNSRARILLALDAGITRSEMPLLRVQHVDTYAGTITTYRPKVKRSRTIPLTPRLQLALEPMLERTPEAPLFFGRSGFAPMKCPQGEICQTLKEKTGIQLSLHSLRHTFATRLAQAGVREHVVRELLGHRSQTITQTYIHASDQEKFDAILTLAEWNDTKLREAQKGEPQ